MMNKNFSAEEYFSQQFPGTPCPLWMATWSLVFADVKHPAEVEGMVMITQLGAKAAIDFARMNGISLPIAMWRQWVIEDNRRFTDYQFWTGWDERWHDTHVDITLDGGQNWTRMSFGDWKAAQEAAAKAYKTRDFDDSAFDVMVEACRKVAPKTIYKHATDGEDYIPEA